jgi:hypothetical protein
MERSPSKRDVGKPAVVRAGSSGVRSAYAHLFVSGRSNLS